MGWMEPLQIAKDVPLSSYSTMRLGGKAAYAVGITSRQQAAQAAMWAEAQGVPFLVVGSGSNIVWRDEGFDGLLIVNQIRQFEMFDEDESNVYLTIGAGENWDEVVARTAAEGLTGIEALSLVPGTAGATPIQNVGAYGQDISQTLSSLEAYDTQTKTFINIPAVDCGFGYRTSRFKTADRGRFIITAITLHLTRGNPEPPFYVALQAYFEKNAISEYTPQTVRDTVIAIRQAKLPDPAQVANNGSFFANPVISDSDLAQITADIDELPQWPNPDGTVKLSAAWLVDHAGFKDYHDKETGMATWPAQALVLVNEHARNTADLLAFKQKIVDGVKAKYNVTLEQEPELLPNLPSPPRSPSLAPDTKIAP